MKTVLLGGMVSLALVSAASAATVTYTSAPFTSVGTTFTPAVQQFDPSLGTLNSATITLHMDLTPKAMIFNTNASPAAYNWAFTNTVLGGAGPAVWTDPYGSSASDNYSFSVGASGGPNIGTAPVGASAVSGSPISETSSSTVPVASLPGYLGLGTVNVAYSVTGDINSGGQGDNGLFFGGGRSFAGTADVTYDFTAVPEPASLGVLGLAGVAVMLRRRGR